jgi:hypothetical protein
MGLFTESLATATEALALWRKLATGGGEGAEVSQGLVSALFNVSVAQYRLGHRKEAFDAGTEAVAIARGHAATRAGAGTSLVAALGNLAFAQFELGLRREALATALEALPLCRQLARHGSNDASETSRAHLAVCLHNLGL